MAAQNDARPLVAKVHGAAVPGKKHFVTAFSHETAEKICERIRLGESVVSIMKGRGMPSWRTMRTWMSKGKKMRDGRLFREHYEEAQIERAEALLEVALAELEALEMNESAAKTAAMVQRARLKVDTVKWLTSKLLAKKYGDKMLLGGDANEPITVKIVHYAGGEPAATQKQVTAGGTGGD